MDDKQEWNPQTLAAVILQCTILMDTTFLLFRPKNCGDTHMSVHLPLFSSLAHSISVSSLATRPFSGPKQAGVIKQAMPTQLSQLPYGRAGWPTQIRIKRGHFSDRKSSNTLIK